MRRAYGQGQAGMATPCRATPLQRVERMLHLAMIYLTLIVFNSII
jgi:hypothetical protein